MISVSSWNVHFSHEFVGSLSFTVILVDHLIYYHIWKQTSPLGFTTFNMKNWEERVQDWSLVELVEFDLLRTDTLKEFTLKMKGLWGVDILQLVMKPLIGLLKLVVSCRVCQIFFLLLYVAQCQETFQGKAVGNEPEVVQGSLSLKHLTQVLCQLFGASQLIRLNIHCAYILVVTLCQAYLRIIMLCTIITVI